MRSRRTLELTIAENGKVETIEFDPVTRPDLYEKWKTLVDEAVRAYNLHQEELGGDT